MNLLLRYYSLNRLYLFAGIVTANLLLIWLSRSVLINEIVFYNTYSEQLTYERSIQLFERMNSMAWISYIFTPVILLIKFSVVSLLIYLGIIFRKIEDRVSLGSVFKVVIASEIVFVFGSLIKFLWFTLFGGNYDLNDLGFFYPLSIINFFSPSEVSRVWIYPLQTINLFHIGYIFSISCGINKVCSIDKSGSEKAVLMSYLPGLALWICLIMFLTIDSSI
jgi:hypothetical protein